MCFPSWIALFLTQQFLSGSLGLGADRHRPVSRLRQVCPLMGGEPWLQHHRLHFGEESYRLSPRPCPQTSEPWRLDQHASAWRQTRQARCLSLPLAHLVWYQGLLSVSQLDSSKTGPYRDLVEAPTCTWQSCKPNPFGPIRSSIRLHLMADIPLDRSKDMPDVSHEGNSPTSWSGRPADASSPHSLA